MGFIRNFLKGASLTTALFIFQACYGPPASEFEQVAKFKIVSADDNKPLQDIAVRVKSEDEGLWFLRGYSDDEGVACVYFTGFNIPATEFRFESEEGLYAVKDTLISDFFHTIDIKLEKVK